MNATITCPRCGERLPAGFTRCDACGAYLVSHPGEAPERAPQKREARKGAAPRRASSSPWIYLVVGLVAGGAVGYALHSAVGPRTDGGAPMGPSDVMSGAAGTGAMGGGDGKMPAEVSAQIQRYRQALMMDPNDVSAHIGLGNLLFDSNQWDQAIEHYTKALEKDPKNADVRVDRAIAYHSLNQDPKAQAELIAVTKSHPEHRNVWLNLGVVSANMGDKATAIRAWEQYLKLEPSGTHSAAIRDQLKALKGS